MHERENIKVVKINLSRVDEVDNECNLLFFPHNFAICAYGSVPAAHAKKLGNWR
jgi:hypothetical protein